MVTRAIVEEIISPYKVRIRVPILDRVSASSVSTGTNSLGIATVCTLPNCYMNLRSGDVVFVAFEDNSYNKAVVLGHLCREYVSDSCVDITVESLISKISAKLPYDTSVGEVTPVELSRLSGASENIQKQIDALKDRLDALMERIDQLEEN